MYSHRICHLLVVAVSLLCLVQASWLDFSLFGRHLVLPRQAARAGDESSAASSALAASSSESSASKSASSSPSQPTTSETAPSTSVETPTSTSASPAQSSDRAPQVSTTASPASQPRVEPTATSSAASSSSAENRPGSASSASQHTSASEAAETSASMTSPTPVISTSIEYITLTNSDGSTMVSTSTSRTTTTPGLNAQGSAETSRMTTKTRNTIIGVVVGVGGAIALGALGFVAWRIWGRKRSSEENDGLMDYDMRGTGIEKPERGSSAGIGPRSPFQSTLENYHQPTQVNASSNF